MHYGRGGLRSISICFRMFFPGVPCSLTVCGPPQLRAASSRLFPTQRRIANRLFSFRREAQLADRALITLPGIDAERAHATPVMGGPEQ